MTTIIKVHGLDWTIEGSGFVKNHADSDYEAGCEEVRRLLEHLPKVEAVELHAAAIAWVKSECDGDRPALLDRIEREAEAVATKGWHNPFAGTRSVSAS